MAGIYGAGACNFPCSNCFVKKGDITKPPHRRHPTRSKHEMEKRLDELNQGTSDPKDHSMYMVKASIYFMVFSLQSSLSIDVCYDVP